MLKDCDIDIQFHRQSLELAYFHQNTHKKNKDFEGGARAWESNLQAFQWDHQKPELLLQGVEVRPPFHNGELPRLLYIYVLGLTLYYCFSCNSTKILSTPLFYNKSYNFLAVIFALVLSWLTKILSAC